MNVALIMGRAGSESVNRKNIRLMLGHPLVWYPMQAAKHATCLNNVYVTTDCTEIKSVARECGIGIIHRPEHLSRPDSEMSDGVVHAAEELRRRHGPIDVLVTMHANCATHRDGLIDECVATLERTVWLDSCVSARVVEDCHPYRLKRVHEDGTLGTWAKMPNPSNNRQSIRERAVVLDGACRAIRVDRCLPPNGQPPFPYLGNKIGWVENPGGLDVHCEADLDLTERWLRGQAA